MENNEKNPLPVDPVDGTKIYLPLGKRFSPLKELGEQIFDDEENI